MCVYGRLYCKLKSVRIFKHVENYSRFRFMRFLSLSVSSLRPTNFISAFFHSITSWWMTLRCNQSIFFYLDNNFYSYKAMRTFSVYNWCDWKKTLNELIAILFKMKVETKEKVVRASYTIRKSVRHPFYTEFSNMNTSFMGLKKKEIGEKHLVSLPLLRKISYKINTIVEWLPMETFVINGKIRSQEKKSYPFTQIFSACRLRNA